MSSDESLLLERIDELEAALAIRETTCGFRHEEIKKRDKRIAELERENQMYVNSTDRLMARVKELEAELATTKLELAVAKDSADKWFTKCRAAESELAKAKDNLERATMLRSLRPLAPTINEVLRQNKLAEDNVHLRACLGRLYDSLKYRHEPDLLAIIRDELGLKEGE